MRSIEKGSEPEELRAYRLSTPDATYDGYSGKDALRQALAHEQGYLCAYCMSRINAGATEMKIEHFRSQAQFPDTALDYGNMLGVCKGGEGKAHDQQHCDTRKGNTDITINPLDGPERFVHYLTDGSIASVRADIQRDLDNALNLNVAHLKRNRQAAWQGIYDSLKRRGDKAFTAGALTREIARLQGRDASGRLVPYCGHILYFLEKKLRSVQGRPA